MVQARGLPWRFLTPPSELVRAYQAEVLQLEVLRLEGDKPSLQLHHLRELCQSRATRLPIVTGLR